MDAIKKQFNDADYPWRHHVRLMHFGIFTTVVIGALPSLIWLTGTGAEELWGDPASFFRTLAKVTAFSALSLFAWTSILGLRIRVIMRIFGGFINKYRVHAKLGRLTTILAALHPIMLLISLSFNDTSSWTDILNLTDITILTGYLSLTACFVLIFFAVSKKLSHAKWLNIHTFFAWLVPVYFVHALLAQSELTANAFLLGFFAVLVAIQIASYIAYVFLRKVSIGKHLYEIVEVNKINDSITELVLNPEGEVMRHVPGQFAYFSVKGSKHVDSEPHPFTISTANNGKYLRIDVKALGDWSSSLAKVETGLEVVVDGPYGEFCANKDPAKKQVWIAGGVGITPFLSMARAIQSDHTTQILMYYSTKDLDDAAFFNELLDISKLRPDVFTVRLVTEKYSGYLNTDDLKQELGDDLTKAEYHICGPPGMMHAVTKALKAEDVASSHINTEEFSY